MSCATARTAFSSKQARPAISPTGWSSSRAIRSSASAWGAEGASGCYRATRSSASSRMSTSSIGRCSVRQTCEGAERRLLLAGGREETGLPADADVRVVAQHEPDHQVDPRIGPGDRVGLAYVRRLTRKGHTEDPIGRSLPCVLRDPDPLLPPELVDESDEIVDVPKGHSVATGLRCRRLARAAVVRIVTGSVEIL